MAQDISLIITNYLNNAVEFPQAPSEFEFKRSSGNEKAKVMNLGEIVRLANMSELGTVSLELQIPIDLSHRKSYFTARQIFYNTEKGGEKYIEYLNYIFTLHEVVRVMLTNTLFNGQFIFDDFSYKLSDAGDIYEVSITMTEWRDYSPLIVKKAPMPAKQTQPVVVEQPRPAPPVIGVGSVVIVNGPLFRDSYGTGQGLTEVNARRKVNFTAPGRVCPYHVTNMEGGWRGWVKPESIRAE